MQFKKILDDSNSIPKIYGLAKEVILTIVLLKNG